MGKYDLSTASQSSGALFSSYHVVSLKVRRLGWIVVCTKHVTSTTPSHPSPAVTVSVGFLLVTFSSTPYVYFLI